ncbi:MAG: enoyl-CoA hydratase/isomerase family protein [Kofleriaceae bacterium]|nr:enoyl-CoA hydratase/isomerase family protein [Kofleriaceae bacterium]
MEPIEVERQGNGNVALLRMRGGKANAMNIRLLEALEATLEEVDDADAIAITGDGSSFSAGLALPELIELDREGMAELISTFERVMKRVLAFPRATVAAINGHAFAGGCVLGLMCDVRLMSAGKIGLNEIQLGIGLPSIVIEPLRIRVPPTSHGIIALEGRTFAPDEAARIGLVDEVVDAERLIPRALELAASRAVAPLAYAQIKRALLAPTLTACDRRRETDRETWLETWFSEHAQKTLRAAVARITKR